MQECMAMSAMLVEVIDCVQRKSSCTLHVLMIPGHTHANECR
jgi:hypothetical protein